MVGLRKARLLNDVSMSELYTMRNAGMNNQEIANALGVSKATIHNHLGKQGRQPKKPKQVPTNEYTVISEVIESKDGFRAEISYESKSVQFYGKDTKEVSTDFVNYVAERIANHERRKP